MNNIILKAKQKIELEDDVIDDLFEMRSRRLYLQNDEKERILEEYEFEKITYDTLTNEIDEMFGISNEIKKKFENDLDEFLEIESVFNKYYRKKLYLAGINDAINFIFNENNEESEKKDE